MKFMYSPSAQGNYGTVRGLYSFYTYLNRMFKKILSPKDGDNDNITFYTKNLLAKMDPVADPFSVFHFLWEEIKSISTYPMKSYRYAPCIMLMIENVTKIRFIKDVEHKPLRIACLEHPIVPSPLGASSSIAPYEGFQDYPLQSSFSHTGSLLGMVQVARNLLLSATYSTW